MALDEVALLIAAHARLGLDVEEQQGRLDEWAQACPTQDVAGVVRVVLGEGGLTGNRDDYYDPRNSLLDQVLDRRLGVPITLAVVTMEVARRVGVDLVGVGMPGHFLLGHGRADDGLPQAFFDPFDGGRRLDRAGCQHLFEGMQGTSIPFEDRYLAPAGPRAIVHRMLANLEAAYRARGDGTSLAWVLRLRSLVPGMDPPEALVGLARAQAGLGRYDDAADTMDDVAGGLRSAGRHDGAKRAKAQAIQLRARLN